MLSHICLQKYKIKNKTNKKNKIKQFSKDTQAFWTWTDEWERHIDWMAMHGINMPLAFTGQEFIFAKTLIEFNFTFNDLTTFFSGPGFFAWQRMGNIRGWGGPITNDCIYNQYLLQLNIIARMLQFNMIPALTAFAGHVPQSILNIYPNADVTQSPNWWNGPLIYSDVYLLNFTDPLFIQIGSKFIQLQAKYYTMSHIYQCDTFNEMDPTVDTSTYLQDASKYVYQSMAIADPHAVWLMQG